jgi:hypothetical protein
MIFPADIMATLMTPWIWKAVFYFGLPWLAGCIVLIYSAIRIIKILIWGDLADE